MKEFILFVKTDCQYCKKAINLLSLKNWPFIVTVVDKNAAFLEKTKLKWEWNTVPIIISNVDGKEELLGGCAELEVLLMESQ